MDKRALKRKLLSGLGWSASIAVGAGAFAAVANIVFSYSQGYLSEGGSLAFGGTLIVVLSTSLFVFPLALLFFWIKAFLTFNRKKNYSSELENQ